MTSVRPGTEESRERKIALFWTLVRAFETSSPITQDEIVATLHIDEFPVTSPIPNRKLAYDGKDNAFRQKFERDKAAIRDLGFEITTVKNDHGLDGYVIDPASVFVPAINFTDDELNVVAWATQLLGIGSTGVARLFVDGPTSPAGVEFSPVLLPLTRAMALRRGVRFRYHKDNDKVRERELAPLEFLSWHGQIYVIGVEAKSQSVKGFRVSRIDSIPTVTADTFAFDESTREEARTWLPQPDTGAASISVRFETSNAFARLIKGDYDVTTVSIDDSDDVMASIAFSSLAAARRAVVSFGDQIRFLKPKALRDDVAHWLRDVNRAPKRRPPTPTFATSGARPDTLGQTLQLIAAVYQAPEPLRASQLASRCHLDIETVRSIMSRVMALQYVRDPTTYLVDIELGDEIDEDVETDDPLYARSAHYDTSRGSTLAPLTWRDAFELLIALKEAAALYPSDLLSRSIAKIESTVRANVRVIEVELEYLSTVRDAIDRHEQLKINYWSASSDRVSERWVEPRAMASRNGRWYFRAWCTSREAWLTFRVDRILYIHAAGAVRETRPNDRVENWVDHGGDEGYVATVVLPRTQRWLFEPLPTIEWASVDNEYEAVRLRVRDDRFLDQLMVEAGPGAWVMDPLDSDAGRKLADRMRQRM